MNKKIITLFALTMTCAVTFSGCKVRYEKESQDTVGEKETVSVAVAERVTNNITSDTIKIRYSNSAYTSYLEKCKAKFEEQNEGTSIILEPVEKENYLVNIGSDSIEGTNVPDLYIIGSDELATAYLAGLASKVQSETFVKQNYDDVAVNACSYNKTPVAYPISFKTTFLTYNSDYVEDNKSYTIEDIKTYSENADFSKIQMNIKKIFDCNINDLFMNYGFFGSGINIGGKDGCDASAFSVCNDTTIKSAESYVGLINFFSLDSKIKYEDIVTEFIAGEAVFSIVSTDSIAELEKSDYQFVYEEFPDYSTDEKTSPLSITTSLVVNPYGGNISDATVFAEFIAGEMAAELFDNTGFMSTNKNIYQGGKYEGIYKSYLKSSSKNKLKYGEQVYPLIEIAMHNIASGEDIKSELQSVDEYMKKQIG